MKSPIKVTLGCMAAIFALLLVGCSAIGPLSRSDEKIRASILKQTPLSCSWEEVHAFVKAQRWPILYESRDKGLLQSSASRGEVAIGIGTVECELGVTHFVLFPFHTDVLAYWVFDKNGRLTDVWVDQQTDAT
jgi:hypothetical protein